MSTESDIRASDARLEELRERRAKVELAAARREAATLEDFEGLDDTGKERVRDVDPALFNKHFEALAERNMKRFMGDR